MAAGGDGCDGYGLRSCDAAGCHGGALIDYGALLSCVWGPSRAWAGALLAGWTALLLAFVGDTVLNYGVDAASVFVELVTPTREMAAILLLGAATAAPEALAAAAAVRMGAPAMGATRV